MLCAGEPVLAFLLGVGGGLGQVLDPLVLLQIFAHVPPPGVWGQLELEPELLMRLAQEGPLVSSRGPRTELTKIKPVLHHFGLRAGSIYLASS